ncbi:MAG: hypothetical protein IT373_25790, partial [Polyangiaceae bacterium]|nr:hypothetical protein [Polyangiaceae bacterium]
MPRRSVVGVPLVLLGASVLWQCGSSDETEPPPPPPLDPAEFLRAPKSCAYLCPNFACAENETPYACPALGDWAALPHEAACPAWDGLYPAPVAGQCAATVPSGAAILRPGPDPGNPGVQVLPNGRAVEPAGAVWIFDDPGLVGGMTSGVVAVPGTSYVLAVDTGSRDHAVRAVDTSLVGAGDPVTAVVAFTGHDWLDSGLAFVPPGRVYVPTAFGVVQALAFDPATGGLVRDDTASLPLPLDGEGNPWAVASVAASPDGRYLLAAPALEKTLLVFDIDPASATYLAQLSSVALGYGDGFAVAFDPHDPTGTLAYVSLSGGSRVIEIDLADPTAPVKGRTFVTDSAPEGMAFLDARWLVVANDYGETLSLVDRVGGTVTSVPVEPGALERGLDLSQLAWDEPRARLYALYAGIDAVAAWDVDLAASPPLLTPLGQVPTAWWPSGIVVHPDGSLTVTNLRGKPIGALLSGSDDEDSQMRGSLQQIPAPGAAELAAGEAAVAATLAVGERAGYPTVACPPGVDDFPVPATNDAPSELIRHVVFIVRENKTFDALLGDLPNVEGDPNLTLKASTAEMEGIWRNFRDLGRAFALSDNFYNLAVSSVQGHQWTTYGRTTDFCERTWAAGQRPIPFCGITPVGRPDEGSIFDRVQASGELYALLGEIVGVPQEPPADFNPVDVFYPGGPFQNIGYSDIEKACYFAGRARVACDVGSFVYMTLPNDHTQGVAPESPTPETMCATNDEATGMVIDAISHSPFWASSLIVITEDDPQQGGDHVDYHRTPLVLVSPWVKRGYVSQTHIDVA